MCSHNHLYCFSNTFAAFDANHDGFIDFTEFLLAIVAQNRTDIDGSLEFTFEL